MKEVFDWVVDGIPGLSPSYTYLPTSAFPVSQESYQICRLSMVVNPHPSSDERTVRGTCSFDRGGAVETLVKPIATGKFIGEGGDLSSVMAGGSEDQSDIASSTYTSLGSGIRSGNT